MILIVCFAGRCSCSWSFLAADVMDPNNMSVDPHMMHGAPQDIKPNISQLNIITSSSGYSNHRPTMQQQQQQHPPNYPIPSQIMCGFAAHHNQPGYFSMDHLQQMSPEVSPQGPHHSPSLHSPSGMSMTSPPPSLTPLQSPTSTMGSPSGLTGGMTMNQAHSTFSTKHICAICGDRASGKHYGVYRYVRGGCVVSLPFLPFSVPQTSDNLAS